ncbi:Predicted nuclease (RNAse H fold) [Agrococcus baldri]|uniref:Predicted nuclease (RNAse H fold) n=1 Tax=Agrococcus baldri TaxID=153730 RepID=A0AA94HMH5_9MICO|nr:DUF429 domain-containing protein [Agrococcus baldri]SFS11342.1 Predicted nuclease (RNAse H fold) [Agrococcus baldri]
MTATSVHIGIDLAWGPKNRTGLAAVSSEGRLLASGSALSDDEILGWISGHADALGVVAIDAPLVVTNASGRRRCESLIQEHFGRYDAYAHSTNLGKPEFNPPRGAVLAGRLGLPLDPDGPRSGVAIEVYPHPAMVGLWELDLILKYKHKTKYPFDFRKREFGRLLDLLDRDPALRVTELPRWGELCSIAAAATKHGDLNRIEDEVDGIVCAWLAWLWATSDARLQVYGDVASGYIVAPPAPTHLPRARDLRIAPTRAVRIVGNAAPAASVVASPAFALDGPSRRWSLSVDEARVLERTLLELRDTD